MGVAAIRWAWTSIAAGQYPTDNSGGLYLVAGVHNVQCKVVTGAGVSAGSVYFQSNPVDGNSANWADILVDSTLLTAANLTAGASSATPVRNILSSLGASATYNCTARLTTNEGLFVRPYVYGLAGGSITSLDVYLF